MLMLPPTVRVYVAVEPVDMRKGFDSLACVVRHVVAENPLSGHLFVFFNRRADVTKKGRFTLPRVPAPGAQRIEMEAAELALLLEGIDLRGARQRPRWEPVAPVLQGLV